MTISAVENSVHQDISYPITDMLSISFDEFHNFLKLTSLSQSDRHHFYSIFFMTEPQAEQFHANLTSHLVDSSPLLCSEIELLDYTKSSCYIRLESSCSNILQLPHLNPLFKCSLQLLSATSQLTFRLDKSQFNFLVESTAKLLNHFRPTTKE